MVGGLTIALDNAKVSLDILLVIATKLASEARSSTRKLFVRMFPH